jgi:hypothetical protein
MTTVKGNANFKRANSGNSKRQHEARQIPQQPVRREITLRPVAGMEQPRVPRRIQRLEDDIGQQQAGHQCESAATRQGCFGNRTGNQHECRHVEQVNPAIQRRRDGTRVSELLQQVPGDHQGDEHETRIVEDRIARRLTRNPPRSRGRLVHAALPGPIQWPVKLAGQVDGCFADHPRRISSDAMARRRVPACMVSLRRVNPAQRCSRLRAGATG